MAFSNPKQNIAQFGIGKGFHVADFGVGSGELAISAAHAAGEDGRVYAIDLRRGLLLRVKNQAREEGLENIEIIFGDLEQLGGSGLADNALDAVIVSNILFQLENKPILVREVRRILRDAGKVLVIDWSFSHEGLGPSQDYVISERETKKLFEKAGFSFLHSIDAGDYHYGLVFRKG